MAVAVYACALTGVIRRYAAIRLLDLPKERGLHDAPTPRGGGLAIGLAFLTALGYLAWRDSIALSTAFGLAGAGTMVLVVGFIDDHRHVSVGIRLTIHFVSAAWLIAWMGTPAVLLVFGQWAWWLPGAVAVLSIMWLTNLYNFMDGIDGLAGVEAVTVCIGGAMLVFIVGDAVELAQPALILASATVGFLVWNFPSVRIFMGDAGSGFLGIAIAGLALHAASLHPQLLWSWMILLGCFIVDATLTLFTRAFRLQRLHMAHRSHAYQFAALKFQSHSKVTLAVGAINLVWLFPIAVGVATEVVSGLTGTIIGYAPLVATAAYLGAGGDRD